MNSSFKKKRGVKIKILSQIRKQIVWTLIFLIFMITLIPDWTLSNETWRGKDDALLNGKKKKKNNPFTFNLQAQTKDVLCNPRNPVNPDSRQDYRRYSKKKITSLILSGNYARSSHWFESGFSGCIRLNIMVICLGLFLFPFSL